MGLLVSMIFTFITFLSSATGEEVRGVILSEVDQIDLNEPFENARLSGRVTDSETGNPLQGATIYIVELRRGTSTDSDGFFTLTLPTGEYTLRIQFLGMETLVEEITLNENIWLDLELTEQDTDLDEIVVEGVGFGDNIRGAVTGVEVVSISDLTQLPQFMGEIDIVQSLTALPGVQTVGEGASGFNVRGGREDQNLVLMDGAPIFNSSHVLGLFSVFNPDVTAGYALYKGHMPERFGGRLSSVLDVSMRSGSMEEFKVNGGLGLYSGRLMIEGPIIREKTSFLLSGRGAASGIIFAIAGKGRDMMRISLPADVYGSSARYYDNNANITHRLNSNNTLSLSYYGSNDFFRLDRDFGYSWGNQIGSFKWSSTISDNLFSEFSAAKNSYKSSFFTPDGPDAFLLDTGIGYERLNEHIFYTGINHMTLTAGAEWTRYKSDAESMSPYHDDSVVANQRVEKDSGQEFAIYIGNEIELGSSILFSAGLRYSHFDQLGPGTVFDYEENQPRTIENVIGSTNYSSGDKIISYSGFEPRLTSRISITENSSVKLSYNRTRQYIHQISNSTSPTPADIWQVSTQHLPPQKSHNYSLGYFRNFAEGEWETSIDLYYRDVDDLVEYIDFADLFLNSQIETDLISARGQAYGSEFNIRKRSGKWSGWLSYTLGRTFVKADSDFPERRINRGEWFPSNYDQPHNFNLTAVRSISENSAFSYNFIWRSGRPITAINSNYLDNDTTVPVFSDRNRERIPDYIRVDISFTIADNIWKYRVPNPNRRISDSANITFYNILGRRNAFSVFYKRAPGASIPSPNRLSVLGAVIPSFTYNFNF